MPGYFAFFGSALPEAFLGEAAPCATLRVSLPSSYVVPIQSSKYVKNGWKLYRKYLWWSSWCFAP